MERRRERLAAPGADSAGVPPAAETAAAGAFVASLRHHRGRRVIAEVKLGSPRLGSLVGRVEPERQARLYAAHGAAALSVVVEPDFFHGSYELLARCRAASGLPTLAKDFVVDDRQLEWARRAGAGAVLLIAALYSREELTRWAAAARGLGLEVLVELHDPSDLAQLAGGDWPLVGVNNRDLRTFEVDLGHSERLVPRLPEGALKVAESGLGSPEDLARLERAGFDAFLIGESLLLAADPAAKLRELLG
ncbi:MAG: indole-3-glycerol-phosphate synthase [Acidobacteriota bacterium]|nr:indole-3-glycerol-phosphate synthase [Acidobacteriota bacterium]MDH3522382.1 indole-3-glycerol-phosphate synthase [Acidobacteriota bacterium]